ncbi:unnamed protein product [Meloidogyne enterolobii]|uniref:Uncharacterized protein n=1 Tax=Meloidogyne enterolobii TaxID=390850 RepID=A0ACB1AKA7_MELEN
MAYSIKMKTQAQNTTKETQKFRLEIPFKTTNINLNRIYCSAAPTPKNFKTHTIRFVSTS